jgi:hypothetical protein
MRRAIPTLPGTLDAHLLSSVNDLDQDPLEQEPDNGLALLLGRGLGVPECRQILCQALYRGKLGRAWCLRPLALEAFVLRRQLRLFGRCPLWVLCRTKPLKRTCQNLCHLDIAFGAPINDGFARRRGREPRWRTLGPHFVPIYFDDGRRQVLWRRRPEGRVWRLLSCSVRLLSHRQSPLCVNDDETAILLRFRAEGAKEKSHGHPQPYGAVAFDS